MNLADLSSIGSFISGIAVLTSLIILWFQLRQIGRQIQQAEKNQQSQIPRARTQRLIAINLTMAAPQMADAVSKGMTSAEGITFTQFNQCRAYFRTTFLSSEEAFFQHVNGLFTESAFSSFVSSIRSGFRLPGFRAAWSLSRDSHQNEFVAFMDRNMSEAHAHPVADADVLAHWKKLIREEAGVAPDA